MNYDNDVLGVGNPQHPANQIEVTIEIDDLSGYELIDGLYKGDFNKKEAKDAKECLESIVSKYELLVLNLKELAICKDKIKQKYQVLCFEPDCKTSLDELQKLNDKVSSIKKQINRLI